jgi:membrane protein YqaA with SNARE-associated domain
MDNNTFTGSVTGDMGLLFGVSFSGPIMFWLPASTEVLAATIGRSGMSPLLVGVTCACGQCTMFALIFLFGDRIAARWSWLRRQTQNHGFARRGALVMTLGAATIGLPPTVPLFTIAASLHMRLSHMLLIVFAARAAHQLEPQCGFTC